MIYREQFLTAEECQRVHDYIFATEDEVKATGPDIYAGTAENSLTGRFKTHNYLYTELGELLIPKLKDLFRRQEYPGLGGNKRVVATQCWANIFRKGEGIGRHRHNDGSMAPFLSANLFISGPSDIGTTYVVNGKSETVPNVVGEIAVFPDHTYHYVRANPSDTPRVSMAMDFHLNTFLAPRYIDIDPYDESQK